MKYAMDRKQILWDTATDLQIIFKEKLSLSQEIIKWWIRHYCRIIELASDSIPEKSRVLDVGLGFGITSVVLSRLGYRVFSTEHPSREYLKDSKFIGYLRKHHVKLLCNELLEGIPFKDNSFSLALLCDVIEHIAPQYVPCIIEESARVLSKDGYLIITTPNICRLECRIRMITGKSPNPKVPVEKYGETLGHVREYSLEEVKAFLHPHFEIIKEAIEPLPVFDNLEGIRKKLSTCLKKRWHSLADEIYILAKKR